MVDGPPELQIDDPEDEKSEDRPPADLEDDKKEKARSRWRLWRR
jgi:hypothetical protein